jgi:hypothetical protein
MGALSGWSLKAHLYVFLSASTTTLQSKHLNHLFTEHSGGAFVLLLAAELTFKAVCSQVRDHNRTRVWRTGGRKGEKRLHLFGGLVEGREKKDYTCLEDWCGRKGEKRLHMFGGLVEEREKKDYTCSACVINETL